MRNIAEKRKFRRTFGYTKSDAALIEARYLGFEARKKMVLSKFKRLVKNPFPKGKRHDEWQNAAFRKEDNIQNI